MTQPGTPSWSALPGAARIYVAAVISVGAVALAALMPLTVPRPALFAALLVCAVVTSTWKITLPISLASGSTLSVACAADLMALLLLGPGQAMIVAAAGAWAQCTVKVRQVYPAYRTAFSIAAQTITMAATSGAYLAASGGGERLQIASLAGPVVAALVVYFVVNTGLVAGAIALSTRQSIVEVWRHDFLWSGASFVVAATIGALAALVVDGGAHWLAVLMLAPVYLTYRTYQIFMGRMELLEREQAARASAEEANRLKDQFLATVSHELRTPLNAILGWADILRTGKLAPGRRDRALQAIYESARHQAQLVDDLLDVSRIMSGKLRLQRSSVDLHEIVRAAAEIVQPAADAKRIRVVLDLLPCTLQGDGARLQQIAWNLLTNAVKFTPEGGAVHVIVRRLSGLGELVVADTGEGIARDFLPSVFEPFRQADGSMTRRHGGLGLGLSIVKHLVGAHAGEIYVESAGRGQGATFTVRMPLAIGSADDRAGSIHSPGLAAPPPHVLEGVPVLVVDGDADSRGARVGLASPARSWQR